ncbi:hypothetical protein tb265_26670 [Gemmatimonadetes bacterium T265]|nr:hypothetical protein tb265_26670 [Gemmatimonadetes bacterium T265]
MSEDRPAERRETPEAMTEAIVDAAGTAARAGGDAQPAAGTAAHDAVDWWTDRLIEASELEAAVVDALSPERDALHAVAGPLHRLSLAAARGLATAQRAATQSEWGVADRALARAHARLAAAGHVAAVAVRDAALADAALADPIAVGVSRGFAHDALFPETYAAAARRLAARVGPRRALVVGLRGIGAGLSAVVADTLARRGVDVRRVTVRPRGDRHDRTLAADDALDALLREAAATPGTWAVVVDEGPGATGSSFAGTAAALAERGFDDARIALFASRDVDAHALASASARARWPRHRRFVVSVDDAVLARGDVRCHVAGHDCRLEAVRAPDGAATLGFRCGASHDGDGPVRLTFVGLGHYGRARAAEAHRVAEAGAGPRVLGLRRGFLITADDVTADDAERTG